MEKARWLLLFILLTGLAATIVSFGLNSFAMEDVRPALIQADLEARVKKEVSFLKQSLQLVDKAWLSMIDVHVEMEAPGQRTPRPTISFVTTPKKFIITLLCRNESPEDLLRVYSDLFYLTYAFEQKSPLYIFESLYNSNHGEVRDIFEMTQSRYDNMVQNELKFQYKMRSFYSGLPKILESINAYYPKYMLGLREQASLLERTTKSERIQKSKAQKAWREKTDAFNWAEDLTQKLNDFLAANDRRSVRLLIDLYLPWGLMGPFERNLWMLWLDSIENPDVQRSTLVFRALNYDNDKKQFPAGQKKGKQFGFMSTLLSRSQGSYTRRLRGLTTKKNEQLDTPQHRGFAKTGMMEIFGQHAEEPVGSPLLSFTTNPDILEDFLRDLTEQKGTLVGGLAAFKIDSRRLTPNLLSSFTIRSVTKESEAEYLASLVVFPDEMIVLDEGFFNAENHSTVADFLDTVSEVTRRPRASLEWNQGAYQNYLNQATEYYHSLFSMAPVLLESQSVDAHNSGTLQQLKERLTPQVCESIFKQALP